MTNVNVNVSRAQLDARRVARARWFVLGLGVVLAACLKVDFDPASVVNTVRVFATRADKPYAKPGETVQLEMLAHDGRADRSRPMKLYWIPLACINPPRDLYYLCFAQFAGVPGAGGSAGTGAGGTSARLPLQPGADITAFLQQGPKFSFTMPADAITSKVPTPGASAPYGLAILFNVACTGRVKIEAPSDNPQDIPIGCYDDAGNKLGPDEFVIGFTRVYAYADITNSNPELIGVTFEGQPVGPDGIVVDRCLKEQFKDCDEKKIGVIVPDDVAEVNPLSKDDNGNPQREQIWVAHYSTIGRFGSEIRLINDPSEGRVPEPDNKFRIPREVGTGLVWLILRDNRGGVSWRELKITVK